jgi:hypothetical protein
MVQRADRRDQHVGATRFAIAQAYVPLRAVPARLGDLAAEADELQQPVLAADPLEVALDLLAASEAPVPLGIGLEAVGIGRRVHVAGDIGVGVLAPGAAELRGLLVDAEIGIARFLEPDRHQQARHPGADDHHTRLAREFGG